LLMAEAPIFFRRPDALNQEEASYSQDLLYRTIKIGTELEFALPKGVSREDFQPAIEKLLEPSRDMERLGRLGVYDVVKEHCGVEVQIIGRHPHWDSLLRQYQQIVAPLLEQGVRMRPTCGLHFHLLGIGLAETIPEIILANLWNMARKYAPGLKYLTSGGDSWEGLCRRRQHNAHQEFVCQSPSNLSMREIQANLKKSLVVPEHQNFFNLEHLEFDEGGAVRKFHLEFRFPDGDLSAVSVIAKTFLFLAMVLKSVEISKFGLLHVGRIQDWNRRKMLLDLISNNDGMHATSDTSAISREMLEEYRDIARKLLKFLKSIFVILDNPSEIVLQELVERPISLRRIDGDDWQKIDADLGSEITPPSLDQLDYKIIKIIELGLVEGNNYDEWLKMTAIRSGVPRESIRKRLEGYKNRDPIWDQEFGRMVFLR
jgi:hypothetical protein